MLKRKIPLRCRVIERVLTIEVGIDTLRWAAEHCEAFWQPQTDKYALVVSDPERFAKDVCDELMRESEDGSTPLHYLFDKAFEEAVNGGSDGVDHNAMDVIEEAERAEKMPEIQSAVT